MRGRFTSDQRGGITIVAAAIVLLLLSITIVVVEFGAVLATTHRARSVADLAALAAAGAADRGVHAACAEARAIVGHTSDARLTRCAFSGWDALVTVSLPPPSILGRHTGAVVAFARAGPTDDDVH